MKKILVLLLILILPMTVLANEKETEYTTEQISQVEGNKEAEPAPTTSTTPTGSSNPISSNRDFNAAGDAVMNDVENGTVTINDLGNKVLNKLYEIAGLLKQIAAPISIITFVIGAIMMVLGALGKRDGMKGGIIVCVLSVIMYAICMYSEEIIVAVSNWMVS